MEKKIQMLVPSVILFGIAFAWIVYGATMPDFGITSWGQLIIKIVDFLWVLAVFLAIIMIVIAGFYFVNSNSGIDPNAIQKGKDLLKYSLIGLVSMTGAEAIVRFFFSVLTTGKGQ
jgi:hypothetical protein